ncbi:MAG: hypothetical protein NTY45_11950 [Elusimicrobia bacterium]|nr:hypothetical protein [Elusimicrobiota bacterium]
MGSDPINVLLIVGAVAGLGVAGGYYLVQYLKGSIIISLPRTSFASGETIEGSFEMVTRQEVRGNNLSAALVATEVIRERGYNGRSTTHTRELSRTGQTLEHAKVYPAGSTARYDFKILVPGGRAEAGSDSMLGQALGMLSGAGRSISWRIEVRLDAEGVDLSSSQRIAVDQ